jgi:hypothetical protein
MGAAQRMRTSVRARAGGIKKWHASLALGSASTAMRNSDTGCVIVALANVCTHTARLAAERHFFPCGTNILPKLADCPGQREMCAAMEPYVLPCQCGGAFQSGCSPRCSHCNAPLSADKATSYIEENAPGTKKGWRWQRNWSGLYCIVIEEKLVENNFR